MANAATNESGIVHVWSAVLDIGADILGNCQALLSEEENLRAIRFHFQRDTAHYIAARGFLRALLAQHLCIPPECISFDYGKFRKPSVSVYANLKGLQFSLSHSGNMALCAIAYQRRVGVDLEIKTCTKDWQGVARSCLAREELDALGALAAEEKEAGFLKTWTQKEAYIKALGEGLAYPLQKFCIPYKRDTPSSLAYDRHAPQQEGRWEFHDLRPSDDHIATLAVEGTGTRVQLHTWNWQRHV